MQCQYQFTLSLPPCLLLKSPGKIGGESPHFLCRPHLPTLRARVGGMAIAISETHAIAKRGEICELGWCRRPWHVACKVASFIPSITTVPIRGELVFAHQTTLPSMNVRRAIEHATMMPSRLRRDAV